MEQGKEIAKQRSSTSPHVVMSEFLVDASYGRISLDTWHVGHFPIHCTLV